MTTKASTEKTATTSAPKTTSRKPAAKAPAVPMATCLAGQHEMPIQSFPTEQRREGKTLTECRRCRDARYAAAKAAKVSA